MKRKDIQGIDRQTSIVDRRKNALEPYMIPAVEKLVKAMLPIGQIPGMLGVRASTFKEWLAEGARPDCSSALHQELYYVVHKARAEMNEAGVQMLKAHAVTNPKALMDLLKAVDPETWVAEQKVKVDKNVNHTSSMDLSRLTDEQIDQYENLLRLASGE